MYCLFFTRVLNQFIVNGYPYEDWRWKLSDDEMVCLKCAHPNINDCRDWCGLIAIYGPEFYDKILQCYISPHKISGIELISILEHGTDGCEYNFFNGRVCDNAMFNDFICDLKNEACCKSDSELRDDVYTQIYSTYSNGLLDIDINHNTCERSGSSMLVSIAVDASKSSLNFFNDEFVSINCREDDGWKWRYTIHKFK